MPGKNGGARPGSGRKPKTVEDQSQSVLAELFDEKAERAIIANMIATASLPDKQSVSAATWLWDRKYGKVTDRSAQLNITPEQLATLSDKELEQLITKLSALTR